LLLYRLLTVYFRRYLKYFGVHENLIVRFKKELTELAFWSLTIKKAQWGRKGGPEWARNKVILSRVPGA
jgi:hypothetical protein